MFYIGVYYIELRIIVRRTVNLFYFDYFADDYISTNCFFLRNFRII